MQKIIFMKKTQAAAVCGNLTQTSKMPCKSSSLPTEACITGHKMAQIEGSICSVCYADRGFYRMYEKNIKPAQHVRLDAVWQAMADQDLADLWVSAMAAMIGSDLYFRHHDSGDLQGIEHLKMIADLCDATPHTRHWMPTREYGIVKSYVSKYGAIPKNLIIRLSAMYPDQPVKIPASLQGIPGITASNVHSKEKPHAGIRCTAPDNAGSCTDCRACWSDSVVSYEIH
jgi:hypothetical protein